MGWQPILERELARRGWAAVEVVAGQLSDPIGTPAEALFWAYLSGARDDPRADEVRDVAVHRLVAQVGAPHRIGLLGGRCEQAWVIAHVVDGANDRLADLDRTLATALAADRWTGAVDVVNGLAGLAIYLHDRDDMDGVRRVVHHLSARAHRDDSGATWLTPRSHDGEDCREAPAELYDCGLAHGVPGIIAVLSRVAPEARVLRDDAIRWLVAQRRPDGYPAYYGGAPARTAWCYGEPGIALALHAAGVAPDFAWMRADHGIADASLCHGAAGLAHICNRFFQSTGNSEHREAARAWFERALAYPHAGHGLLTGAAGVGLALLAALTPNEPAWDRLLLCDIR